MYWLSIAVAAVAALLIGYFWYNPKVFGNVWMKSLGLTEEDLAQTNMLLIFGIVFILAGVLAIGVANVVIHHNMRSEFYTFEHGAFHGFIMSIFVATPILTTNALFERRNWKSIFINIGYWMVTLATMGGIINAMAAF